MIILTVNVNTKKIVDPANMYLQMVLGSKPSLVAGEPDIAEYHFVTDEKGTPFALNDTDLFELGSDTNFIHTDSMMFYSDSSKFTIVNAAGGIVRGEINTNTVQFLLKVTKIDTSVYMQLRRYLAGSTYGTSLLLDQLRAQPTVINEEGSPQPSNPEYLNETQVRSLVATKLNKVSADDLEFTGTAGIILADRTTAQRYRITMNNGALEFQPLEN